jgi:DNA end-binding protein Ku
MANVLIESMGSEWEPERFQDTHRQKVEALIEEKSQGKTIATVKPAVRPKVVDLMEALQASISARQPGQPATKAPRSTAAAKKEPSKRPSSPGTAKNPATSKAPRRRAS